MVVKKRKGHNRARGSGWIRGERERLLDCVEVREKWNIREGIKGKRG